MKRLVRMDTMYQPKDEEEIVRDPLRVKMDLTRVYLEIGVVLLQVRSNGSFKDHAIYLPDMDCDWHLGKDEDGISILVATEKE